MTIKAIRSIMLVSLVLGGYWVTGCSQMKHERKAPPRLLRSVFETEDIMLEVAVAEIEADQLDQLAQVWAQVDTQSVSLETRRILDANGFRAGVISSQMPASLRQLLGVNLNQQGEVGWQTHRYGPEEIVGKKTLISHQQLHKRHGESHFVPASDPWPSLRWEEHSERGTRKGYCEKAICGFELVPLQQGQQVTLIVTPKIQHGETRTRIGVIQDAFAFEDRAEFLTLDPLTLEAPLRAGETLMVGAHNHESLLAKDFFTSVAIPAGGRHIETRYRLMLIRLVSVQPEALFADDAATLPLATPIE